MSTRVRANINGAKRQQTLLRFYYVFCRMCGLKIVVILIYKYVSIQFNHKLNIKLFEDTFHNPTLKSILIIVGDPTVKFDWYIGLFLDEGTKKQPLVNYR